MVLLTGDGDFGEKILSLPEIHPGDVVTFLATTDELKYEPRREKTNILVSDQVPHKPGCTATQDG